ncbi:MAG TPA: hypothetical protein ENJ08_03715 [Gammaproteobacteria bacterium]|nr:hypothetical protein [Gammaproteobacteria bacterium]
MPLNKNQAREIADELLEAAQTIDTYLDDNFNNITRAEYEYLYESFKTLTRTASYTTTIAVGLAIEESSGSINQLKSVITQAKQEIKNLQKIGHIIKLTAALADLAASIMSKDPKAVVSSAKKITITVGLNT